MTKVNGGGRGAPAQGWSSGWLWGRYSRFGAAVAAVAFILDQASKWWLMVPFGLPGRGRVTLTPFFDLVWVKNIGISYSLLGQSSYGGQIVLAGFGILASLALWIWLSRGAENRLMAASLGLVIGGALGNALDRVLLGGVADFASLHAFGFYWYVFNVADVAIVAGVAGLLYDSLLGSRKDAAKTF
jgi:signal peptidase II